ncbi:polyphenol oxidase family protein [Aeromicrobium wangtongii]|uniref:Polyphenol oxidase family protein n=1 Tax=Aeromicrobium wangtongii TaxID=2969247 RepID=A0ABY5MCZ1_9ACTN|nr:polyphenol oxidase family protein [Aeromicrobium wangtongii]MCD9197554.1 polyphenol oxidase family protein [Aeromicrobium wangtongii]UUP15046.1 polyphenol oxidase family protein [Aeromicrobium wangtongii]
MFWQHGRIGAVEFVFTDRLGGTSDGPWESLNLADSNGDDPDRVAANLAAVAEATAVDRLILMTQVHGRDVVWESQVPDGEVPVADALLTDRPGVGVLVRVADCTPVVLADREQPLAGVVHCGRVGLVEGVIDAAVSAMRDRGATALQAVVGPRACGRCYELPAELADSVAAVVPQARSTTSWGTDAVDVGAGVLAQLAALDVPADDLGAGECTIEHDRWFSYRRQGPASGRFGAVAVIRA